MRSNGTVTYVGKDIAYQLVEVRVAGQGLSLCEMAETRRKANVVWATTQRAKRSVCAAFWCAGDDGLQRDRRPAGLSAAGGGGRIARPGSSRAEAEHSIHLSYEIVALTPRCAAEMGYELLAEEAKKPYVEVSGRKGLGVKADDLIDKLEAAALAEVQQRHADMSAARTETDRSCNRCGSAAFFSVEVYTHGRHRV